MSDSNPILGSRDRIEREVVSLQALQSRLQRHLASYGYLPVDVPLLERSDLYLRKLGSQMAALMFNVTDHRGERLSLRPEFTGSVVRCFIDQAERLNLPVRWQYCGPVFRDRDTAGGVLRQFTQFGCELIGAAGPRADAELLAVTAQAMVALGLPKPRVVIGHAGLAPALLAGLHLSERALLYITTNLGLLRAGDDGMAKLEQGLANLERTSPEIGDGSDPGHSASATSLIQWFLAEGTNRPTGRRSSDQIVRRFRQKVLGADTPERLSQALDLLRALAGVLAAPAVALQRGEEIAAQFNLEAAPLASLRSVLGLLAAYRLEGVDVQVDLGLNRPLGYYTGLVFELYADADGPAIGGGGRYDGLVRALGGGDVATLGFAFELERLQAALLDGTVAAGGPAVLVAAATDAEFPAAVAEAGRRRAAGVAVELEVNSRTPDQRQLYCRARHIDTLVTVGGDGVSETAVQLEPHYA